MRRPFVLMLSLVLIGTGCSRDPSGATEADLESLALVPDFAESMAASVDGAGVGAAGFPDELQLTIEQEAALAALHEGFKAATASDVAELRAIEAEARAAVSGGKSRDEVRGILARGAPILARLGTAFAALQEAILQRLGLGAAFYRQLEI